MCTLAQMDVLEESLERLVQQYEWALSIAGACTHNRPLFVGVIADVLLVGYDRFLNRHELRPSARQVLNP